MCRQSHFFDKEVEGDIAHLTNIPSYLAHFGLQSSELCDLNSSIALEHCLPLLESRHRSVTSTPKKTDEMRDRPAQPKQTHCGNNNWVYSLFACSMSFKFPLFLSANRSPCSKNKKTLLKTPDANPNPNIQMLKFLTFANNNQRFCNPTNPQTRNLSNPKQTAEQN